MSKGAATAWRLLGREQGLAAAVLREQGLHRACTSRAYYAVYSEVTGQLVGSGRREFGRFRNPGHAELPSMISNGMSGLDPAARRALAKLVRRLRSRREDADYRPEVGSWETASRVSMQDVMEAARILGRTA